MHTHIIELSSCRDLHDLLEGGLHKLEVDLLLLDLVVVCVYIYIYIYLYTHMCFLLILSFCVL